MSKTLEFFFDLGSPATYLAYTQLPKICAQTDSRLIYIPILLGGVFKATGNASRRPSRPRAAICFRIWSAMPGATACH